MQKRKVVIIGLIGAAALAAAPFCMDYGNDGWRIFGWRTGLKAKRPKVNIPDRFADATNERLSELGFKWHEAKAIYELGRRGVRELEPQLVKAAEAPQWEARTNKTDIHRFRKYEGKIAALAVLAKWKVSGAEENLLRGFSIMPDLEHSFVQALAYVNSTQSVQRIKSLKDYQSGVWKCSRANKDELGCAWTGLQYLRVPLSP